MYLIDVSSNPVFSPLDLTMSGIVVSPLLKGLILKLKSLQADGRTTSTSDDLKGRFKDIIRTLETLSAVADDARQKAIRDREVQQWLHHVQIVLHGMDDVIDMVQIMNCSNGNEQPHLPNQVSSAISRFTRIAFAPKSKLKSKSAALALRSFHQSLVDLSDDAQHLSLETSSHKGRPADVYTDGAIEDAFSPETIDWRRSDEEAIINLLLKSDQRVVSVVPIVGSLGIGKTTLAGLIYRNKRVLGHFDNKLWMWIGDCPDSLDFWTEMNAHFLAKGYFQDDPGDIKQIKMEIQKFLRGKRVLVVLDDFKDNNSNKSVAIELIDVLSNGNGSAIVVTTRSRRAASSIGTIPPYQLQPLSPDDSYELLTRNSFTTPSVQQDLEYQRFAREVVNLCGRVPLFLKRVGSSLQGVEVRKGWASSLEYVQHLGGFKDIKEDASVCKALFELPWHLKLPLQCFRLQKACGLGVEALICVWMALGFLYSDDDITQPPEHIAREYLKQFVESALCPDVQYAPGGVVRQINFNDVLYSIATATENPPWITVSDGKKNYPGSPIFTIWNQDCVRGTLFPSDGIRDPDIVRLFMVGTGRRASLQFVREIVSRFQHLRVLGIGGCDGEMLPDSIGKLKHLRYLDVGRSPNMISLPDSICDLWHLQTLFLHGCSQLQELPANIGRLQNLRYLTLTILTESLPEAIGQLTSLRTFGLSSCPRLASVPSTIKNLKKLETLAIVKCPELDLESTSSVEAFKGLDSMHTLLLSHLPKFASLPELGSSSVALKHLQILFCTSVTEMRWITQFRSLRSLTIEVCPQLLDLKLADGASQLDGLLELVIRRCPVLDSTAWIRQFVSLRSIVIDACHKLVHLDAGFSELKNLDRLEIRRCPGLTKWFASPSGKDWRQIVHVRSFVGMFLLP